MAFGFSVLLLGSSSLSVPTYACRKGAGFCQAGKRQRRGPGGAELHAPASCDLRASACMAVRRGGGDRGWGWNGQRRGASGGGPPGRAGVCVCVARFGEASGKEAELERRFVANGRAGPRMPSPGRLLGAQRWVQRRAFRPREALGAGEERGRAQSGAEQSEEGILLLSLFLPPIAMRRVHDELVRLWIVERRR